MATITQFESKLPTQQIIVRTDKKRGLESVPFIGFYAPLVRVNDKVFDNSEIANFSLSYGRDLLPTATVTIIDTNRQFREQQMNDEFVLSSSILTLFVGNTADKGVKNIKLDFFIQNVSARPTSDNVTFSCVLYVPKLFERGQFAYKGTSLDTLIKIAEECQLGYVTNLKNALDSSVWLSNTNRKDLLTTITKRSYVSDNEVVRVFVDCYGNLNAIGLSTAFVDRTQYFIDADPEGNPITPEKLLITNSAINEKDNSIGLSSYAPISKRDTYLLSHKETLSTRRIDALSVDFEIESDTTQTSDIALEGKVITDNGILHENVHERYASASMRNDQVRRTIEQGTYIEFLLDSYTAHIFPCQLVDFVIMSKRKAHLEITNQDDVVGATDVTNKNDASILPKEIQTLSGKYFIDKLRISYKNGKAIVVNGTGLKV